MTETTKDIADLREVAGTGETSDWMTWPKVDPAKLKRALDQLEAERQQREAAEEELAALRGEQEPVAIVNKLMFSDVSLTAHGKNLNLLDGTRLFTSQPKPVVVTRPPMDDPYHKNLTTWIDGFNYASKGYDDALEAAGIVVKDGE